MKSYTSIPPPKEELTDRARVKGPEDVRSLTELNTALRPLSTVADVAVFCRDLVDKVTSALTLTLDDGPLTRSGLLTVPEDASEPRCMRPPDAKTAVPE